MNIYVGGLPSSVSEAKLRSLFEQYGTVDSVKLIKDRFTGEYKGFGFVEMPEEEQAQDAIAALNGFELEGKRIMVSQARPREQRPNRSFGGGGNGGNGHRGGPRSRFGGSNNRY